MVVSISSTQPLASLGIRLYSSMAKWIRLQFSVTLAVMVKRVNLARRKDGMSVEEIHAYWTGPHVAVVRKLKNLRGLRVNLVLEGGADREWDGIGELWFDGIEA